MNRTAGFVFLCGVTALLFSRPTELSAQPHPWPLKDFVLVRTADAAPCAIETTDGECLDAWRDIRDLPSHQELEADLKSAASFYEDSGFVSPYLEEIRIAKLADTSSQSEFPNLASLGKNVVSHPVHPVRAASNEFVAGPSVGIAMYLSYEACYSGDERREAARSYLGKGDEDSKAIGRSIARRNGPSIVSDPHTLANNSDAVKTSALPHELFHSVQHAYPSITNELCGNDEDWYLEGMTDAMALSWIAKHHHDLLSDTNQRRIRGWRAYNYPLHEPFEPVSHDEHEIRYQTYGTSSFWRYLGISAIRHVLEFKGAYGYQVERLDDSIKARWTEVCKNLMTNKDGQMSLPAFNEKDERISCDELSKYSGLYLVYPLFIADFVESQRHADGALSSIFLDKTTDNLGNSGPASLRRENGCFVAPVNAAEGSVLNLPPISSECFRLPAELAGRVSVTAEPLGQPRMDHLFLSWKGEVHAGVVVPDHPTAILHGSDKLKIWYEVGTELSPLSSKKKSSEDVLLVFSNVAPEPLDAKGMDIRITFLMDSGKKHAKLD